MAYSSGNIHNVNDWSRTVLERLGIKPNHANMQAMVGWARAEGGHWNNSARHNPLNTTQDMPGAGNTGTQGNIKVYRDWNQGVEATVRTLKNGRYGGILRALKGRDPMAVANAISQTPWGTSGDLVRRTIGSTKGVKVPSGGGSSMTPVRAPRSTTTASTTYTPGVDNSVQRNAVIIDYFRNREKPGALLGLISGMQSTQDVPGSSQTTYNTYTTSAVKAIASPAATDKTAQYKAAADMIDAAHFPYVWGGGHDKKRKILKGAKPVPVDCSGAVSMVLGINPRVAAEFKGWGRAGRGKKVTVWAAKDGSHVLMEIDGHFFGTSHANAKGGAGWIPRAALGKAYLSRFIPRHPAGL